MEALENWREEKRSAYLYQVLAAIEANPVHKKLFFGLSSMAEKQALIWQKQLIAAHVSLPAEYHPGLRVRIIIGLVRCFGIRSLRVALAAMKIRGMSIYQGAAIGHPLPTSVEEMEYRHRNISQGSNLRAAVFGVNDGLISNTSLILGIAGANAGHSFILLSGIAGLLAGACSMSAGEFVSVRSQREMLEYQLKLEKNELDLYPEEEAAELALIYEARGLPKEEAEKAACLLIQDPEKALDTLAREELGINPKELISPWGAAVSSFFSFSLGAFVPIIPFVFGEARCNLVMTVGLTALSLFGVGAALSLFTQRSALGGGLRMLFIGVLAGGLTYLIGSIFRVAL
jgi:VIT1/CCC1 family predicted Fe2+/Mn2+ transporter